MSQSSLPNTVATNTLQPAESTNKHHPSSRFATPSRLNVLVDTEQIEAAFTRIQNELHHYDEDRLIEFAINAEALERCAFLLRGMIAYELQSRVTERLSGGRGHKDQAKVGIKSKMYELAERVKVNYKTLARACYELSDVVISEYEPKTISE